MPTGAAFKPWRKLTTFNNSTHTLTTNQPSLDGPEFSGISLEDSDSTLLDGQSPFKAPKCPTYGLLHTYCIDDKPRGTRPAPSLFNGVSQDTSSYLDFLASYEGFLEKVSKSYQRNEKVYWNSRGFCDFLTYQGAKDFGFPVLERVIRCGVIWKEQEHKKNGTLRYYGMGCGDTCLCGRCSSAKSRQRVSQALGVFTELIKMVCNSGVKLECRGLEIELTIPKWLSELFCEPSNRSFLRQWTDRFFKVGVKAIKCWFKGMGVKGELAGVEVLHWWKSGSPWKPHVHLHFVLPPVYLDKDGNLKPIPRWYEGPQLDLLRGVWKRELEKEFGEGIEEELNVHVSYLKRIKKAKRERKGRGEKGSSLEFCLEYMYRSPVGDFARCLQRHLGDGMFEVEMIPEGGQRKERIKGMISYRELRGFIDLVDAFSAPRKRESQFRQERKENERRKKAIVDGPNEKRFKREMEELKEESPELYNKIMCKTSKRTGKGKGGLERIRWFGFLAKRNLGEFFKKFNVVKEKVESSWKDTGREFEYLQKTVDGVEVVDIKTGEVIRLPSILINNKSFNVGGKKWVWKYRGRGSSP